MVVSVGLVKFCNLLFLVLNDSILEAPNNFCNCDVNNVVNKSPIFEFNGQVISKC